MSATFGVTGEPSWKQNPVPTIQNTPQPPTHPSQATTRQFSRNDPVTNDGEPSAPPRHTEAGNTRPLGAVENQAAHTGLPVGVDPEPNLESALEGIPAEHVHSFTTVEQVLGIIAETQSSQNDVFCPYLAFLNTPVDGLHSFDSVQSAGIRKQYFESTHVLIIKLPSGPHETVTAGVRNCINRNAVLMGGVDRELSDIGSKTYKPTRTIYSDSCKEGDEGILPHQRRGGQGSWPTLIFETGVSEALGRLQQDARWWFEQSNHSVHAVIVSHVLCDERIIDLEIWRMQPIQHPRPATRSNTFLEPRCDHRLRIDCSTTPATTTGAVPFFIISFEALVLRPRAENETDFLLTQQDIEYIATVFRASL
ncbi:unnamed protein product [Tuber aestivum]|uniref:Uncharacterized protein n=1 Tax=Tuber aestivum TaxID=59557 RepID=A0A292Q1U8_9PEZI|nr:unnamed protein product [Tuber aestivum]